MRSIRIALITPPVLYARHMPIANASLTAFMRSKGFEVKAWDLNTEITVENDGDDFYWAQNDHSRHFYEKNKNLFRAWVDRIMDFEPDIIGFTVWSTTLYSSLKLAMAIKKRDKKKLIVFGGYLCSSKGKELFNYPQVDVLVRGEGENTLLHIAEQLRQQGKVVACPGCLVRHNGVITDGGARTEIETIDALPFPDFSDFDPAKYLYEYHIPIIFHRGCSWRCAFCTTTRSWGKARSRSAENIYQEIVLRLKQYPQLKQFEICDPAFNQDVPLLMQLCDRVIAGGHQLRFSGLAQIRTEMGPLDFKKAHAAGFRLFNYGMESGSQRILQKMGKPYSIAEAERVIRDTHAAGMDVVLNFVVGFPGETDDDFRETLGFIERNKEYISNIAPAHECDLEATPISAHPDRFGVSIPRFNEYERFWETIDGTNTFDERKRRKQAFDGLLNRLGIPIKCGVYDRKEYEDRAR